MPSRTRSATLPALSGQDAITQFGSTSKLTSTTPQLLKVTTSDVIGDYGNDHQFLSNKTEWIVHTVSATRKNANTTATFTNFPPQYLEQIGSSFLVDPVSDAAYATKVISRSNPSRPTVNLPLAAYELKDLPHMIRQAGDAIHWLRSNGRRPKPTAEGLANANLAYQFGWEPLIDDLWKLLTFQEHYVRKRNQLERLFSGRGLRRNLTLNELSDTTSGRVTLGFGYDNNQWVNFTKSRTSKVWGSVRWKPTVLPPGGRSPTDLEVYKAALGLDITLETIWDAMPWSWLVDWFTSAGDFLGAYKNTIPATFSNVCIMRTEADVLVFSPTQYTSFYGSTPVSWGGATRRVTRKSRSVNGVPVITGYLPFLGSGQLSILGSLAITRGLVNPK